MTINQGDNTTFWDEEWRDIVIEEGITPTRYQVSNYGRVRSFAPGSIDSRMLNCSKVGPYKALRITKWKTKQLSFYVHRLVAEYFITKPSESHDCVVHLNYNPANNYVKNLKWVTREEQFAHRDKSPNVKPPPRMVTNAKLTEADVIRIKKMLKRGKNRLKMIAKQFGITHTQLNRIRSGENWGHIKID